MITKEQAKEEQKQREKMLSIAKPYLLDCCADPFLKNTAMTLLARVEKKGSGVGDIILELMGLAMKKGLMTKDQTKINEVK